MGPQNLVLSAARSPGPQLFPSRAGLAGNADRRRIAAELSCNSERRSQRHQQESQHDLRFHVPLQAAVAALARILSEVQSRKAPKMPTLYATISGQFGKQVEIIIAFVNYAPFSGQSRILPNKNRPPCARTHLHFSWAAFSLGNQTSVCSIRAVTSTKAAGNGTARCTVEGELTARGRMVTEPITCPAL